MKILYMIMILTAFTGCSVKDKVIEQQQINLIMQAMTTGQWKVSNFMKGSVDQTADFNIYKFQFKDNYTVDAINNGTVERTGNWSAAGDINSQTITASFGTTSNPLELINGTWNIVTTTWTSVHATQTVNGEPRVLKMEKL